MMKRAKKTLKRMTALFAVLIILVSICITPAHAVTPFSQRSRAFIASALAALNIMFQSTTMNTASMIEYVADPMNVTYTYLDAWQDRPEIQIYPDYTVIDGRAYTDIWISNEAAEKFRVDAWDFQTAYAITSNNSGNIVNGFGEAYGVLLYQTSSNTIESQHYIQTIPNNINDTSYGSFGDVDTTLTTYSSSNANWSWQDTDGSVSSASNTRLGYSSSNKDVEWYLSGVINGQSPQSLTGHGKSVYNNRSFTRPISAVSYDPFDFDYVSQTIPADVPLDQDQGMMIRVPSDDGNGNRYFDTWLHDNPEFDQGEPVTIDVQLDPTIETKLDDLLDILIPIMPIITNNLGDIQFIENHTQPQPQPDTLLPDTYWSQLENKLDQIRQTIQNLNPDFSQIIQAIQNIPQSFSQITSPIVQAINNLGDTILRDIEEGPIKLLDKLIDVLRSLFFPILATLRGFLGIWHYVVTWMGNISAPFTWIMGLMAGASPILVSPIYAFIAGIIVIAVYRRFGR